MWRGRQQRCRFVHSVAILITFLPHHVETTSVETRRQGFSTAAKVYVMKWWENYTHSYLRRITLLLFMTFAKSIIKCDVRWTVYHFLRHASTELGVTSLNFWPRRSALTEWHWDKFFTQYFDFPMSSRFFQCSINRDIVSVGGRISTISLPGESTCHSFDHQKWSSSDREPDSIGVNDTFASGIECRPFPSVLTWKSMVVGINYEVGERNAKYTFREPPRIVRWYRKLRPHCDYDRLCNGMSRN